MARNTPKGRANAARWRQQKREEAAGRIRAWGNRPRPPSPALPPTCDAVAQRLAEELQRAGRGPVHIPRVYAALLLGWIRNYQARVTAVYDALGEDEAALADLRTVFDPDLLERPLDLPALAKPPRGAALPPAPAYRWRPGEEEPEPIEPDPRYGRKLRRILASLDENDLL